MRRRHIDLRIVKRLIRRPDVVVILGECGGLRLRTIEPHHRSPLWETLGHAYAGPGGKPSVTNQANYRGYEFRGDDGSVMLYLEQR